MAIDPNSLGFTCEGRVSYENFWDGKDNDQGLRMHTLTLIFRKGNPDVTKFIEELTQKCESICKKHFAGISQTTLGFPLRDGDNPEHNTANHKSLREHYYINFSKKLAAPEVVDAQLNPVLDRSRLYGGVWLRLHYILYPYTQKGKRGVGTRMLAVQLLRDDTRLGGVSASTTFKNAPVATLPSPDIF
jgi:Protein of unknown function (DUF2815)